MGSRAMGISKKRGREKLEYLCCSSSCSASNLSLMQDESAASSWSKEVIGVIQAHLGLLQQHYYKEQCRQHRERGKANDRTMRTNDWESDDCVSVILNGGSEDDTIGDNDNYDDDYSNDDDDHHDEQSGIGAVQLVDLISCQAAALPEGWEQHLDLRTGQVFYIHWKSCKTSHVDPRKMVHLANESILKLMGRTREAATCIELQSSGREELLEERLSECITSQNASMPSQIGEEVQSKYTPHFICDSERMCTLTMSSSLPQATSPSQNG